MNKLNAISAKDLTNSLLISPVPYLAVTFDQTSGLSSIYGNELLTIYIRNLNIRNLAKV